LRNAVIHKTYVIGSTRITYLDKEGQEKKLFPKEFSKMSEQFDILRQYIQDYRSKLEIFQKENSM